MTARKVSLGVLTFISLCALPMAANAATPAAPGDNVAYQAIVNRDWAAAEQQLLASLQREPNNSFAQLNLAWVYAQTGRKAEAAALYQEILRRDQDRVATLSSRDGQSMTVLARRGLALLEKQ
jgi:Tfp pilus assembly protein PilF